MIVQKIIKKKITLRNTIGNYEKQLQHYNINCNTITPNVTLLSGTHAMSAVGPTHHVINYGPHIATSAVGPSMPRQQMRAPTCHVSSGSHLSVNVCVPHSAMSSVGPTCQSMDVGPTVPRHQLWATTCHVSNCGSHLPHQQWVPCATSADVGPILPHHQFWANIKKKKIANATLQCIVLHVMQHQYK